MPARPRLFPHVDTPSDRPRVRQVRIVDGRAYATRPVSRTEAKRNDPPGAERWR